MRLDVACVCATSLDGAPGGINVAPAAHPIKLACLRNPGGLPQRQGCLMPPTVASVNVHAAWLVAKDELFLLLGAPQWPGGPTATSEVRAATQTHPTLPPRPMWGG